jgi:hypothetical protein
VLFSPLLFTLSAAVIRNKFSYDCYIPLPIMNVNVLSNQILYFESDDIIMKRIFS